jgi:hypothetical protein
MLGAPAVGAAGVVAARPAGQELAECCWAVAYSAALAEPAWDDATAILGAAHPWVVGHTCRVGAPGDFIWHSHMRRQQAYALTGYKPGAAAQPAWAPGPVSGRFRLEGDWWDIAYTGESLRLRDAKGLRYIHRLLSHPGREVHVAELLLPAGAAEAQARPENGAVAGLGDAGELLDPRAKAEYRRRVEDLREEVEEASRWGDHERRAQAEEELDFISRELAAAFGLGGRARRAADTSERIRKAVSNRIRDSLARIARQHPFSGDTCPTPSPPARSAPTTRSECSTGSCEPFVASLRLSYREL